MESIDCFFLYPAFWLVLFPGFWLANRPEMATSDWSDFLAVDWLTMEHISILLPPKYIFKKQKTAYSSRSTWIHSMCYSIFSFMCMFCRSLFLLCTFSFGHCVICSSSISDSDYPFDYLQTLLHTRFLVESVLLIYLGFLFCGVPNVDSVSWLSILDCPFWFL